jgi:hypothetical protein
MPRPRMRPSFSVGVACNADDLMDVMRRHLALRAGEVEGDFSARNGVLRVPPPKRRFWTPYLDLTIEDLDPQTSGPDPIGSKLWGTFSPRPEIWTAFVFAIGTLVVVSIFASVFGIAQLVLAQPPFALLVPVAAFVLAVLTYVSALVGQGLSIAEMYRLRSFVDDCLREVEEKTVRRPRTARDSSQL